MKSVEPFTLADREWLAEMHVTAPDEPDVAAPVEVEANPVPVAVSVPQMPAAGPVAALAVRPAETAWSVGRCILIGLGAAVALFVVMMLV
jgi:phosphoribosylcarboxyaminoimidazole (NCAIR) mutase